MVFIPYLVGIYILQVRLHTYSKSSVSKSNYVKFTRIYKEYTYAKLSLTNANLLRESLENESNKPNPVQPLPFVPPFVCQCSPGPRCIICVSWWNGDVIYESADFTAAVVRGREVGTFSALHWLCWKVTVVYRTRRAVTAQTLFVATWSYSNSPQTPKWRNVGKHAGGRCRICRFIPPEQIMIFFARKLPDKFSHHAVV